MKSLSFIILKLMLSISSIRSIPVIGFIMKKKKHANPEYSLSRRVSFDLDLFPDRYEKNKVSFDEKARRKEDEGRPFLSSLNNNHLFIRAKENLHSFRDLKAKDINFSNVKNFISDKFKKKGNFNSNKKEMFTSSNDDSLEKIEKASSNKSSVSYSSNDSSSEETKIDYKFIESEESSKEDISVLEDKDLTSDCLDNDKQYLEPIEIMNKESNRNLNFTSKIAQKETLKNLLKHHNWPQENATNSINTSFGSNITKNQNYIDQNGKKALKKNSSRKALDTENYRRLKLLKKYNQSKEIFMGKYDDNPNIDNLSEKIKLISLIDNSSQINQKVDDFLYKSKDLSFDLNSVGSKKLGHIYEEIDESDLDSSEFLDKFDQLLYYHEGSILNASNSSQENTNDIFHRRENRNSNSNSNNNSSSFDKFTTQNLSSQIKSSNQSNKKIPVFENVSYLLDNCHTTTNNSFTKIDSEPLIHDLETQIASDNQSDEKSIVYEDSLNLLKDNSIYTIHLLSEFDNGSFYHAPESQVNNNDASNQQSPLYNDFFDAFINDRFKKNDSFSRNDVSSSISSFYNNSKKSSDVSDYSNNYQITDFNSDRFSLESNFIETREKWLSEIDIARRSAKLTKEDSEESYLREMNYLLPNDVRIFLREKFENQILSWDEVVVAVKKEIEDYKKKLFENYLEEEIKNLRLKLEQLVSINKCGDYNFDTWVISDRIIELEKQKEQRLLHEN